jgi:hypothetical protein
MHLLQTALEEREDGKKGKTDDARMVHKGFFAGAKAVIRWINEPVC